MISCKCECIHNEHGECSKEDIVMGLSGCLSMIEKDNSIYAKVLKHYGHKEQKKKTRQELSELAQELTESIINVHYSPYSGDNCWNVLNEMADVLNMFESLKVIFGISNEELHDIMAQKMQRTLARIEGEQGQ